MMNECMSVFAVKTNEQTENAKTTIAEPIEMTWVPWAIVGMAVAMFIFVIWRMEKEEEKFNNDHGSE